MIQLVSPSKEFKQSFIQGVTEYEGEDHSPTSERYSKLSPSDLEKDFDAFVEKELSQSRGENLPEGYVPQTIYWLVDGDEFIGNVRIRHSLTEHLREIGGHIGYDIRPSKRGKGYGNKILELALQKARELGIENVRITCDATNVASKKIIEKNGGVLESQVPNPETGVEKCAFGLNRSKN